MTPEGILRERSEREFEKFKFFFSVFVLLTGGIGGLVLKKELSLVEVWMLMVSIVSDIFLLIVAGTFFVRSERYLKLLEEEVGND
ncbi:hypothetical protein [Hydrogenivirga sp.]